MLIASVGSFMAAVALIALLWPIPGVAGTPDHAPEKLRYREGSRAALSDRHRGLARSVDPVLLLPRSAAVRSDQERSLRLPGGGKERKDAGCARFEVKWWGADQIDGSGGAW